MVRLSVEGLDLILEARDFAGSTQRRVPQSVDEVSGRRDESELFDDLDSSEDEDGE